jgi:sulfide:quinone oxidoreductase
LKLKRPQLQVAIVEPASKHYYQPLWTLIGAGIFPKRDSERDEKDLIPDGVTWIKEAVDTLDPARNLLVTTSGAQLEYDYLVLTPGLKIEWGKVEGLPESLGKNGVCSIYDFDSVDKTWDAIQNFQGGTAIFTHPSTPIKCGGAPQKICYLAEESMHNTGVRHLSKVKFICANAKIFSVDKYARALEDVIKRKDIEATFQYNLVKIIAEDNKAIFKHTGTGEEMSLRYNLLHVTPPMGPPDFIKKSAVAGADGWVDVNKNTLQSTKFANVYGAGDGANLPTSKTGAAIRKQAPVLVENLIASLEARPLTASYDGYTSCPLVTGYKSLILAEFDYELNPQESFPFDQSKERYSMFLLKKYALPAFYWNVMLKGLG